MWNEAAAINQSWKKNYLLKNFDHCIRSNICQLYTVHNYHLTKVLIIYPVEVFYKPVAMQVKGDDKSKCPNSNKMDINKFMYTICNAKDNVKSLS